MKENREGVAIVTGGDGGMGRVITEACAKSGYHTIMTCRSLKEALPIRDRMLERHPDAKIEVMELELTSRPSILQFVETLNHRGEKVAILVNNAGVLCNSFQLTKEGIEESTAVNYLAPYLLTRLLLPLMGSGSRVVNTVSITYKIGKIEEGFFVPNPKLPRIPRYANSKLALLLFTLELAERVRKRGILVNAADPGIVDTKMIHLEKWFDPLTDLFFRPFIRKPKKGAETAIMLALSGEVDGITGRCFSNSKEIILSDEVSNHPYRKALWEKTEELLSSTPWVGKALKRANIDRQ